MVGRLRVYLFYGSLSLKEKDLAISILVATLFFISKVVVFFQGPTLSTINILLLVLGDFSSKKLLSPYFLGACVAFLALA